ncbi:MAG: hypothetical protein PHO41_11185 [Eubacteriales bacterium]|nr:hypothetical protein [Eubacteriales bacterium]
MNKDTKIHVGIGFATGRKNFLKVLKTYIYNWKESGLTDMDRIQLHIFIAYDLQYSGAKATDFTRISHGMAEKVDSIQFVDAEAVRREARMLTAHGVLSQEEAMLFFSSGYAAMRNAVLYTAVKEKMDYLLFLDDDEYPLAVTKAGSVALWSVQHVLANHLNNIRNADVTNGFHCGYISPIPSIQFNDLLTEADFRQFIEAISNDIINWENMSTVMRQGGVTYADTQILRANQSVEVPEINHCKFISGSNLCLNLTQPERMFPFYNPPGSRGEDTFLSTCLSERKVLRIPSYAFHNGFGTYNYLLSGVMPTTLKPITSASRTVVTRFYRACVGWVRYKPLLTYITKPEEYDDRIRRMRENLTATLPKMAAYFHVQDFKKIMGELNAYDRDVHKHYHQFQQNKDIWQKLVAYLQSTR